MMSQYIIHMAYYHYFLKPVSLYLIYVIVIARGFLCYICLHKAFNSLAWVHLVYSLISRSLLWIDFSINNKQESQFPKRIWKLLNEKTLPISKVHLNLCFKQYLILLLCSKKVSSKIMLINFT